MISKHIIAAWLVPLLVMSWPLSGWAGAPKPPVETSVAGAEPPVAILGQLATRGLGSLGLKLSPQVKQTIMHLLHGKLAASGAFRMIAPKTVAKRLRTQKRDRLRACVSGDCAVELGHALAASHVLIPRLLRIGDQCMALLTLYDVPTATAELATTENCTCEEAGFVTASLKASGTLASAFAHRHRKGQRGAGPKDNAQLSFFVSSTPQHQPLWVDGKPVGQTPKVLRFDKGSKHHIRVGALPYAPVERHIQPRRADRLHLRLPLHRDDATTVAQHFKWFGLGLTGGTLLTRTRALFGGELRIYQRRWRHLTWTAFEARFVAALGVDPTPSTQAEARQLKHLTTLATRFAYPLYWGRHGTHQLQLGMGMGLWMASYSGDSSQVAATAIPSVNYLYLLGNGGLSLGVGINLAVPLRSDIGGEQAPLALGLGLTLGVAPKGHLNDAHR